MLMDVDTAASYLNLRVSTLRRWLFERRLPSVKLGRRVLIRKDTLDELIARSERPAVAPWPNTSSNQSGHAERVHPAKRRKETGSQAG